MWGHETCKVFAEMGAGAVMMTTFVMMMMMVMMMFRILLIQLFDSYLCSSVGVRVFVTIKFVFEREFLSDFLAV